MDIFGAITFNILHLNYFKVEFDHFVRKSRLFLNDPKSNNFRSFSVFFCHFRRKFGLSKNFFLIEFLKNLEFHSSNFLFSPTHSIHPIKISTPNSTISKSTDRQTHHTDQKYRIDKFQISFYCRTSNFPPRNWKRFLWTVWANSRWYHNILKCQSRFGAIRISTLTLTDLFRHKMRIMFVLHYCAEPFLLLQLTSTYIKLSES